MKRTCFLLIILLFSSLHGMSNAWNSFVQNFDKKLYGQGSQTWQVSPYDNRWTFFANKKGLLQFDGNEWKTFQMNNQFDVRSVLSSSIQKRIYVGGVNEYGYYEPDEIGNLKYHCMSDTLDDVSKYIGNVWGIQELDNILYFQGDRRVIKWVNENYTPIDVDAKIDCSNVVRGTLYLGTDKGVWVLIGNRFTPLQGAEKLTSMRIRGFLPYKEGMLIVTAYNGLYYFDGFNTTPFLTGLESFMRENEVFCVAMRENTIALGTIHRGILLIDCNTLDVKYINEFSGLYNNTVLSLSFDESGNLWAGLDNGISYIYLNSPYTSLYAYPNSFGTGYSATVLDNKLYLGTNRGLYSTAYPVQFGENKPNIEAIPHSSGQVWNLCKVGDELFCSHDRGLFQLKGTVLQRIGDITGVWLCKPVLNNPDLMFVGTYFGLYLAKRVHNNWTIAGKINDMNDSCRFFEQESETIIWYHNVNHVVRIELTPDLMQINNSKSYYPKDGLPENSTICLTKV
ncbi:MAG: transcriptional regulator, partial [Phocaeicola sp.]